MGKQFKKSKDGSDKPKKGKTGFGMLGVLGLFGAMLGLVSWVASKENNEKRARDDTLRRRLARKPLSFTEHASCRMDCRRVTRQDVEATLEKARRERNYARVSLVSLHNNTPPRVLQVALTVDLSPPSRCFRQH